jgi:hypothetical protein
MNSAQHSEKKTARSNPVVVALFWLYVSVPLVWGVLSTMQKAMALLR